MMSLKCENECNAKIMVEASGELEPGAKLELEMLDYLHMTCAECGGRIYDRVEGLEVR